MSSKKDTELQNLVLRVQKGDINAFGLVYEMLIEDVFRYIYFKIQKEDAGDLCEDVFLKVWENIASYKQQKSISFRSWVFRIAHNCIVDYYRTNNKPKVSLEDIPTLEDSRDDMLADWDANVSLTLDFLQKAISELKDEYQQVIIMKFMNDLSYEEIASVMKRTPQAIRLLSHRAIKELKIIIKNLTSSA